MYQKRDRFRTITVMYLTFSMTNTQIDEIANTLNSCIRVLVLVIKSNLTTFVEPRWPRSQKVGHRSKLCNFEVTVVEWDKKGSLWNQIIELILINYIELLSKVFTCFLFVRNVFWCELRGMIIIYFVPICRLDWDPITVRRTYFLTTNSTYEVSSSITLVFHHCCRRRLQSPFVNKSIETSRKRMKRPRNLNSSYWKI